LESLRHGAAIRRAAYAGYLDKIRSILAFMFREQRIVLNAIRFLANYLGIPLVCVEAHKAKQALMTDQQLGTYIVHERNSLHLMGRGRHGL
jgi:hypothetical protein